MAEDLISKYGMENLVCIHSHRWNTGHNACFLKGLVKLPRGVKPVVMQEENQDLWYIKDQRKIGYLDIETDGLRADFSTMLCWCIKERNGSIQYDVNTKEELFSIQFDKRIVASCIEAMRQFDILVSYNGITFDIAYLRSKAFHYGLDFPAYKMEKSVKKSGEVVEKIVAEIYHFDIYYLVRSKFNLSRKSLDNVCNYFRIVGKTPLDKEIWREAKYGKPEALAGVLEHCKGDVAILEELHKKIEKLAKWNKNPL
jgi:DNA polymerase elongation subunit (family B)